MVMDLLTIYLHYEDGNKEDKILQRSMMRRHVSYYDLILMTEEVGFHAIDFLYYEKKDPQGNAYLVHIDDQSVAIEMLFDPEIGKTVHLYVSKEKASNDIAPPKSRIDIASSNHPNESTLLQESGVSVQGAGAEQLIVRRPQSISLPLEPKLYSRFAYYIYVPIVILVGINMHWLVCRKIA
jgi:hypothetical protein